MDEDANGGRWGRRPRLGSRGPRPRLPRAGRRFRRRRCAGPTAAPAAVGLWGHAAVPARPDRAPPPWRCWSSTGWPGAPCRSPPCSTSSMLFPDGAPSRLKVARAAHQAGTDRGAAGPGRPGRRRPRSRRPRDPHAGGRAQRARPAAPAATPSGSGCSPTCWPRSCGSRNATATCSDGPRSCTTSASCGCPTTLLNKPGKPTAEEWDVLRAHPRTARTSPARCCRGSASGARSSSSTTSGTTAPGTRSACPAAGSASVPGSCRSPTRIDVMTAARAYKRPVTRAAARQELVRLLRHPVRPVGGARHARGRCSSAAPRPGPAGLARRHPAGGQRVGAGRDRRPGRRRGRPGHLGSSRGVTMGVLHDADARGPTAHGAAGRRAPGRTRPRAARQDRSGDGRTAGAANPAPRSSRRHRESAEAAPTAHERRGVARPDAATATTAGSPESGAQQPAPGSDRRPAPRRRQRPAPGRASGVVESPARSQARAGHRDRRGHGPGAGTVTGTVRRRAHRPGRHRHRHRWTTRLGHRRRHARRPARVRVDRLQARRRVLRLRLVVGCRRRGTSGSSGPRGSSGQGSAGAARRPARPRQPQTAPWAAEPTSFAYFASTPRRVARRQRRPAGAAARRARRRRRSRSSVPVGRRRAGSGRRRARTRSARRRPPPARRGRRTARSCRRRSGRR